MPTRKKNKPTAEHETTTRDHSPLAGDESEVELDSLGHLFVELADASYFQDDVDASRADDVEVISISSDSDNFVPQKLRKTARKVPFSRSEEHTSELQSRI